MSHSYTKEDLKDIFFSSLEMFNDCFDSGISADNIKIDFFTPKNGAGVYERFCKKHFPKFLDEPYRDKGYFDDIAAQAFVGESCYGILIRENVDFMLAEVIQMFLHEISHLYCTQNEIPGGNFFDKYCMGSGVEDGMINAGYAIWREAIADIMADSVISENATTTLALAHDEIQQLNREITISSPSSKKAMSLLIAYIMISAEVAGTTNWTVAEKKIRQSTGFTDPLMYGILKLVFDQLHIHCGE